MEKTIDVSIIDTYHSLLVVSESWETMKLHDIFEQNLSCHWLLMSVSYSWSACMLCYLSLLKKSKENNSEF